MLMSTPAIAAVKAGATCSAKGQVKISSGYKYTCIKSGKKLVWSKGVKVAVKVTPTPNPTPTPTDSASPTPTPSQSPTPNTSLTATPTPTLRIISPGSFCSQSDAGQQGQNSKGVIYTCKVSDTENRLRWRQ